MFICKFFCFVFAWFGFLFVLFVCLHVCLFVLFNAIYGFDTNRSMWSFLNHREHTRWSHIKTPDSPITSYMLIASFPILPKNHSSQKYQISSFHNFDFDRIADLCSVVQTQNRQHLNARHHFMLIHRWPHSEFVVSRCQATRRENSTRVLYCVSDGEGCGD